MTDMTNVHPGHIPSGNISTGPLAVEDERELVQLLFDMIQNESYLEGMKQLLVERSDFNLMDAFQMIDMKSLGWVSAPQVLTFLIEHE